jgi:hypothetical protein
MLHFLATLGCTTRIATLLNSDCLKQLVMLVDTFVLAETLFVFIELVAHLDL